MIAVSLVVNVLLLVAVGHLWIKLRCAREAIGRLNSSEWWVR